VPAKAALSAATSNSPATLTRGGISVTLTFCAPAMLEIKVCTRATQCWQVMPAMGKVCELILKSFLKTPHIIKPNKPNMREKNFYKPCLSGATDLGTKPTSNTQVHYDVFAANPHLSTKDNARHIKWRPLFSSIFSNL
jgi:hypothetical protein